VQWQLSGGFCPTSQIVLCGRLEEDEILIITAYEPDPEEWEADWKTRKREVQDV